jgi:hypothetical protein
MFAVLDSTRPTGEVVPIPKFPLASSVKELVGAEALMFNAPEPVSKVPV